MMSDISPSACVRFAEPCREKALELGPTEYKVFTNNLDIPVCHECLQDIYLGFFFNGTNNNKFRDTHGFSHSNVARLYEAYIGTPAQQKIPTLIPRFNGWNLGSTSFSQAVPSHCKPSLSAPEHTLHPRKEIQ